MLYIFKQISKKSWAFRRWEWNLVNIFGRQVKRRILGNKKVKTLEKNMWEKVFTWHYLEVSQTRGLMFIPFLKHSLIDKCINKICRESFFSSTLTVVHRIIYDTWSTDFPIISSFPNQYGCISSSIICRWSLKFHFVWQRQIDQIPKKFSSIYHE